MLSSNERVEGTPNEPGKAVPVRPRRHGRLGQQVAAGAGAEEAIGTRYGIAIPRQSGVVEMLDAATGELRWRYSRSDSDEQPNIVATGNGDYVLAEFADVGYLLLDAKTGHREAAWPGRTRDRLIQQAAAAADRRAGGRRLQQTARRRLGRTRAMDVRAGRLHGSRRGRDR